MQFTPPEGIDEGLTVCGNPFKASAVTTEYIEGLEEILVE
jgi:hypothetical protein